MNLLNVAGTDLIIIKDVISTELRQLLSAYIHLKTEAYPKSYRRGDALSGVHRTYGDPLMETLLARFTPMIETAMGMPLWPTLSFYYQYGHGHQLLPHQDRASCQIVASLCIDADLAYQTSEGTWPLWVKIGDQDLPVRLNYGDLLIFKGATLMHWREKFQGDWFRSAIFAYVPQTPAYAFLKYDQRRVLGTPHIGMFRWVLGHVLNRFRRTPRYP